MAGNLVKSVMLKIVGDDGDAEQKLSRIAEKADELARKHPDIKVKVDSAAASAKLAVLRRELKDTANAGEKDRVTFKGLSSDIAELATGLGAGSGAVGEMSMMQKVLLGLNVATGLGEPLIAGLTVAVGGLSSGITAAGAGLGVFGVVAKSVWSGVSTQISAVAAAQEKIAAGATGKKLIADNKAIAASLKGLNAGQQSLVLGASNAELAWHKFTLGAAAGVSSVLVPALDLVPRALQLAKGFLGPVEHALSGLVGDFQKAVAPAQQFSKAMQMTAEHGGRPLSSQAGGLAQFIKLLQANAGPAITKIGIALGHVGTGITGILTAFMPMAQRMLSGLDEITGKFAKWGQTLSGHSGFQSLMAMFKSETPLAMSALKSLAGIIKTVVAQMTGMSTFSNSKMLLQLAVPVLKLVDALLKAHPQLVWLILYLKLAADGGKKLKVAFEGISGAFGALKTGSKALSDLKSGFSDAEAAASDASGAWGSMGGKLSTVLQKLGLMKAAQAEATVATEGETAAQGELDVAMDANPIGLIIVAVAALAGGIYELAKHSAAFRDFWKAAWGDIEKVALAVFHVLEPALRAYADLWKVEWGVVKTVGLAAFHIIEDAVKAYVDFWKVQWDLAKTVVVEAWRLISDYIRINVAVIKTVLSWFERLGSLFLGWFMDAANAVNTGTQRILSFVRALPGKIMSALSDLGSLLFGAGVNAIEGFIHGMGSMLGEVENVAESIGKSALHGVESFLHIGSPSKLLYDRGVMTAKGFELGIGAGTSGVESAARKMATAAAGGAAAGVPAAGGGGGGITIEITVPPGAAAMLPPQFWTEFMNGVRVRGGDPRIVQKKVKFA